MPALATVLLALFISLFGGWRIRAERRTSDDVALGGLFTLLLWALPQVAYFQVL